MTKAGSSRGECAGGKEGLEGGQGYGKWGMPGFIVDPGGEVLVGGRYTVEAVQPHVILQGPVGREIWLAVDLWRGEGREKVTGWMQSSELQRRAASNADGLARLRDKAREGWSVEGHNWECSGSPAATWHGLRGAVVWWYLPVLVVDEEQMKSGGVRGGVRVAVMTKRVALDRAAGGVD
jgi:hypothetical protein